MIKERKRKVHFKWAKRLPKPESVELTQNQWDNLTAKQRYELRYPDRNEEQRRDQHRKSHFRKKFGITEDDYLQMFYDQNGLCAICGKPETAKRGETLKRLSVDHSHKTGQIRALLCARCNSTLGYVNENIKILENMIDYLIEFEGRE